MTIKSRCLYSFWNGCALAITALIAPTNYMVEAMEQWVIDKLKARREKCLQRAASYR